MTEEHPFFVPFAVWTAAKSLGAGDAILGAAGTLTVVSNAREPHPQGVTVYNLEIEQARDDRRVSVLPTETVVGLLRASVRDSRT